MKFWFLAKGVNLVHIYNLLIFIPARGGSKGIHNKNLQLVGGRSLLDRVICTGLESIQLLKLDSNIVVSTQDELIANEARKFGAEVHQRPSELCLDTSTTEEALLHFLQTNFTQSQRKLTIVAMLQCTSPFTSSLDIAKGVNLLFQGYDSVFLGQENHFWLYSEDYVTGDFHPVGHQLDHRPSRQEVHSKVHETGAGYIFNAEDFFIKKFRIFGRVTVVKTGLAESIDIDEPSDLEFANIVASGLKNK